VSEPVLDREVRRRLAVLRHVEEVSGNVAQTARYFGISRQTYYKWLRRYETDGVDGLRERSKRPRSSPNATRAEVVDKIIHLRRNYHFGPNKIVMYLKRYHDVTISASSVWRILHRLDMGRLPASARYQRHDRRWKRYEKQRPGHQVQIDVKFVEPLPPNTKHGVKPGMKPEVRPVGRRGKFYQFTAIDDCTRLRIMKIYPRLNQKTAIQFLDYVLSQLPFAVEKIQTDNGAEFATQFHWHVLDKGIGHVYIKPRTPRLNGKVERSHRIDAEEFYRLLDGVVIDDVNVFNTRLKEWQDYYNYDRPHGGLNGQTPYERLRQKTHEAEAPDDADLQQSHIPVRGNA
jgi:transposase